MNERLQMVMLTAKAMGALKWVEARSHKENQRDATEYDVLMFGAFYHSGHWDVNTSTGKVGKAWREYERGFVSEETVNFCLDFLTGRVAPNWLINAFNHSRELKRGWHIQVQ